MYEGFSAGVSRAQSGREALTMKVSAWIPLVITPLYYWGGGRRSYRLQFDPLAHRVQGTGLCVPSSCTSFQNPETESAGGGCQRIPAEKAGGTPLCTGTVTISAGV
jgi:hypothetical protein